MTKYVVDANVVMQWLNLPNELSSASLMSLFQQMIEGKLELIAPDFLLVEVSNVLIRKKQLEEKETLQIIDLILNSPIKLLPTPISHLTAVIELMSRHFLSAYDALYLHTAIQENAKLITDDRKLLAVSAHTISSQQLF